jgi:hypothetical protein
MKSTTFGQISRGTTFRCPPEAHGGLCAGLTFNKFNDTDAACIENGDIIFCRPGDLVYVQQPDQNPYASPREVAELADGDLWYHEAIGYCVAWFIKIFCTIIGWAVTILAFVWLTHPRMTEPSWWACLAIFFAIAAIATVIDKQVNDELVRWKR